MIHIVDKNVKVYGVLLPEHFYSGEQPICLFCIICSKIPYQYGN